MTVREWMRMQQPHFSREGTSKFVSRWDKCVAVINRNGAIMPSTYFNGIGVAMGYFPDVSMESQWRWNIFQTLQWNRSGAGMFSRYFNETGVALEYFPDVSMESEWRWNIFQTLEWNRSGAGIFSRHFSGIGVVLECLPDTSMKLE